MSQNDQIVLNKIPKTVAQKDEDSYRYICLVRNTVYVEIKGIYMFRKDHVKHIFWTLWEEKQPFQLYKYEHLDSLPYQQ